MLPPLILNTVLAALLVVLVLVAVLPPKVTVANGVFVTVSVYVFGAQLTLAVLFEAIALIEAGVTTHV